ncbi:homoserine kinase [Rugosimonospora acidiphila]
MVRFLAAPVRVRVPATSANLGPGFDALGLALGLHDEVSARISGVGIRVTVSGEGEGELPTDHDHLIVRCMLATFDRLGDRPDGLELACHNNIPQARGLGSSSAAIVAGILAARALVPDGARRMPDSEVLELASEIEGHPDNVAPCLLGGLTIAWIEDGRARAARLEPDAGIRPTVVIPTDQGLTAHARAALPAEVPHRDAALNAGRSALLIHALTGAPELLMPATEDRLHQGYRAPAMPETAELVRRFREAGMPAVVSGAGPSVLVFGTAEEITKSEIPVTSGWRVMPLDVDARGAVVGVDLQHAERDPVAAGRAS